MNTLQHAKQLQDKTTQFAIHANKAFAQFPKIEPARIIVRSLTR